MPWYKCETDPRDPESEIYKNEYYQVHIRRYPDLQGRGPEMVHLSFKRIDQSTLISYRDKMKIKDQFVGAECEAVELLPARSREVDTANQYHLWCINDPMFRFPFGFQGRRLVSAVSYPGGVQEPWPEGEEPNDCASQEDLIALVETMIKQKKEVEG
jgi:hypothetical protein